MVDVKSHQLAMTTSSEIDLITKSFPLSSHPQSSGRRLIRKHSMDDHDGAVHSISLFLSVHFRVDAQLWLDLISPPFGENHIARY